MSERADRNGFERSLLVASSIWVLVVLLAMVARSSYPLELEWMEGGSLHQARRVLDGEPIYAPPSLAFIPFLYTPLYPGLVALAGAVFGLSYSLARVISIVSTLAAAAAIWKIVAGEGRSLVHRAAAVGLFFAGYIFSFRWLDLARADATFLALVLWSLYWLRRADRERADAGSWRAALVAGVLMALAFWTKQTAALFVIAGGLWTLRMPVRSLLAFGGSIALIDGVGVLLGQALTEGWLWTYIYELHQSHAFNRVRFTRKTWGMFVHAAPFLVALILWRAPSALRRVSMPGQQAQADGARRGLHFWSLMLVAALLASALGYSTQWAEPNAFIPGVAFGASFVVLVCPERFGEGPSGVAAAGLVLAQLLFAFVLEPQYQPIQDRGVSAIAESYRWQDPWRTLPTRAERERADELRDWISTEGGSLWAPQRPWWSSIGGGAGHLGSMGLTDISKEERAALRRELRRVLAEGEYRWVWIEGTLASWNWLRPTMARHFRLAQRREGSDRVLPMIGFMSEAGMVRPYLGPQLLFERIRPSELPSGWSAVADFEQDGSSFQFEGAAFGRRAVASIHASHPAVGPMGGAKLLSSAATKKGLRERGKATGPDFALPPRGGRLHYFAGRTGKGESCGLALVDQRGRRQPLEVPRLDWGLRALSWEIEPSWSGKEVHIEVVDDDEEAAIFVDEFLIEP